MSQILSPSSRSRRRAGVQALLVASGTLACAIACSSSVKNQGSPSSTMTPAVPFEAVAPAAYVAKVKNVLVGLPPTDDEVSAVVADSTALKGLVTGWQQLPEYQSKMQRFFELAFQQTQIS
ncbi:MAG TPA: hypothetical protein VK745_02320, partial [Polyangiaceae bacterium]|nr:hypothetical protein [Polyangiaceae bacterium]